MTGLSLPKSMYAATFGTHAALRGERVLYLDVEAPFPHPRDRYPLRAGKTTYMLSDDVAQQIVDATFQNETGPAVTPQSVRLLPGLAEATLSPATTGPARCPGSRAGER